LRRWRDTPTDLSEEGLRTALRHLQRELRMGPVPVERCLDCGPGA
jgi:dihydrolipoamide dehydrogenase